MKIGDSEVGSEVEDHAGAGWDLVFTRLSYCHSISGVGQVARLNARPRRGQMLELSEK